ncbi:hypothetical protein [Pseudooceanicola onchidii]|uniref:hypothetical protein n=1 Tax=Pseudooceanicola onchidii TaxID=2562279 RepID=UPI0010AA9245|nr:hypothetical protein [Pseudooceanicola onchidii]
MVKVSTVGIAAGSLLLAAGAGFYMQMTGGTPEQPQMAALSTAPTVTTTVVEATPPEAEDAVSLSEIELTSSEIAAPVTAEVSKPEMALPEITAPSDAVAPILASVEVMETAEDQLQEVPLTESPAPVTAVDTGTEDEATGTACLVDMTGESRAAAMVALHLVAPCNPDTTVTFRHDGMIFTKVTDADGVIDVTVPALSETATFLAMLDDGNGAAVEMEVDTLGFYDRSVVQWQGNAGIELHAFEFGADWAGDGHVWSGAPRDAAVAARGEGGFLTRLGDDSLPGARVAEVYTFPTGTAKIAGDVTLSVDVEVTAANCGKDIGAEVIEVDDGRVGTPGKLSLAVPGCDAVGDFIQLKNLVSDLKIAAR